MLAKQARRCGSTKMWISEAIAINRAQPDFSFRFDTNRTAQSNDRIHLNSSSYASQLNLNSIVCNIIGRQQVISGEGSKKHPAIGAASSVNL